MMFEFKNNLDGVKPKVEDNTKQNKHRGIDFYEITIEDKKVFDKYLNLYGPQISEHNFANIFMWRHFYKFKFSIIANLLCIIAEPDNFPPFAYMPLGEVNIENLNMAVEGLKEYFSNNNWTLQFRKLSEIDIQHFKENKLATKNAVLDRDNSDYLYLIEDLINLKGKKYHGKRNHINNFKTFFEYEDDRIESKNFNECYKIVEKWINKKDSQEFSELLNEERAISELLNNYDKFGCKGILIKVDGEYEAFSVGDMLNADTGIVHIEKADGTIKGLYTYLNQRFCEKEFVSFKYMNREQDLGKEWLRKSKLSYHPIKIVNKYNLTF